MKKLMLVATIVSFTCICGGLSAQANDAYSTNSVKVDLTGWEEPEAKPPTDPRPPTGHEEITPSVPGDKLPQTGEQQSKSFIVLGSTIVIIATLALTSKINNNKHIKGEF